MKHPHQAIPTPPAPAFPPATRVDALYLHLPFCFHKCHYCDFYSVVEQPGHDRQAAFTAALIAELRRWADHFESLRPTTVFAGGGTPTYLRPELWAQLLDTMHKLGILENCREFTVEANPETVTLELMQQLALGGVNRVSIGAQSFQRESLAALERWHDPDNVPRAVDACRAAGLDNFSLDLIFAIPGQTLAMLDDDLSRLLELQPTHLSTYGLTYEPNTALTARLRVGKVTAIDEDTQRDMYQHVLDRLEANGFEHYEVSNWARRGLGVGGWGLENDRHQSPPGASAPNPQSPIPNPHNFRCLHNLAYWQNQNWLGVGPAAASHLEGQRWRNRPSLAEYLTASPHPVIEDHEQLPEAERLGERLMLGLRLSDGIAREWIDTNLSDDTAPGRRRREAISEMIGIGMLEQTATHLRLTRRGLFVADSVTAKLL